MMNKHLIPIKLAAFFLISCMVVVGTPVPTYAGRTEVPLYIKYRYEKRYGRKWYDASPERQRAYIKEIREKQKMERDYERRKESQKDLVEANKKHLKAMKKAKKQRFLEARKRRKEERNRIQLMRKQALRAKREQLMQRVSQRRARSR